MSSIDIIDLEDDGNDCPQKSPKVTTNTSKDSETQTDGSDDWLRVLSAENKRLLNELSFERQLNEMLNNFRKYLFDLKVNCFCDQNKQTFVLLDQLDITYKTVYKTVSAIKGIIGCDGYVTQEASRSLGCDYNGCDYRCIRRDQLETHMNTHKPYECSHESCGLRYETVDYLKAHELCIHNCVSIDNESQELPQNDNQLNKHKSESIEETIVSPVKKRRLSATQTAPEEDVKPSHEDMKRLKTEVISDLSKLVNIKTEETSGSSQVVTIKSEETSGSSKLVTIKTDTDVLKTEDSPENDIEIIDCIDLADDCDDCPPNGAKESVDQLKCTYESCPHVSKDFVEFADHWLQSHGNQYNTQTDSHSCQKCSKRFQSLQELDVHQKSCQKASNSLKHCSINGCNELFGSIGDYNRHCNQMHAKFACGVCRQRFLLHEMLVKHELTHLIKCGMCSQRFQTRRELYVHQTSCRPKALTTSGVTPYPFTTSNQLFPTVIENAQTLPLVNSRQTSLNNTALIKCSFVGCNHLFGSVSEHQTHATEIHGLLTCFICNSNFKSRLQLRKHMSSHIYGCSLCGNRYQTEGELYRHKTECHIRCETCLSWHRNQEELCNHWKFFQRTDIAHMCGQCHQLLLIERNNVLHRHWIHKRQIFRCNSCDYVSDSLTTMQNHKSLHEMCTEIVRKIDVGFRCRDCRYRFQSEDNYRNHLMTVHRISRLSLKYLCAKCPQSFLQRSELKVHEIQAHCVSTLGPTVERPIQQPIHTISTGCNISALVPTPQPIQSFITGSTVSTRVPRLRPQSIQSFGARSNASSLVSRPRPPPIQRFSTGSNASSPVPRPRPQLIQSISTGSNVSTLETIVADNQGMIEENTIVLNEPPNEVKCSECQQTFNSEFGLKIHTNFAHKTVHTFDTNLLSGPKDEVL